MGTENTNYGWTCPRCMKVHSPYSTQCDCPPPTFTSSGLTVTFKPCNHRWIRTTKNYKRIKKCSECGEVKEVEEKLPTNCPHCGELINYLNHKKHLYMQCVNDEKKL